MIIKKNMYMNILRREREITIYAPDDYQTSGKRYPVLYINDGQNAFFDNEAYSGCSWGFYDYVKWFNLDVIMVAIPCNFEPWKREAEYGPWLTNTVITIMETGKPNPRLGGEGDAYVQWIMTELKPYMDQNFPTNPYDTGICGSSAGGNISAYAAIKYPHVFKKCAALSCAIWYYPDEYEELIKESDLSPIECFYFDLGSNEGNGNTMITNYYKYTNERMYELLMQKGVDERIHYRVYEGAIHAEYEWRKRVPVFFELFGWTR